MEMHKHTYEVLGDDDDPLHNVSEPASNLRGLGVPQSNHICSCKDVAAVVACLVSFVVAIVVVFVPKIAVYYGQTNQFIWVGLCLTLMGWCAQLPLRRLFLISSTNSKASTLQSFDAILRSDPLTTWADLRVRVLIVVMLSLGPALSVAYKTLGGGESRYRQDGVIGHFGMTGPPGTQDIGIGLSQFVNATLPWFKDPGYRNRVYGFNMHVASENMTAMLDGPLPDYVQSIQVSLGPMQYKNITAHVSALVCEENAQLEPGAKYLVNLWNGPTSNTSSYPYGVEQWIWTNRQHVAMLLPIYSNNSNIVIANWADVLNETFGSHLRQYTVSRQGYIGSWHITHTSAELVSATPRNQHLDDRCLLTDNNLALADLYTRMLAEYDWRYRNTTGSPSTAINNTSLYTENIKSDSTFLAAAAWSRIVATEGPEIWLPGTAYGLNRGGQNPSESCPTDGWPELSYDIPATHETAAITIKPGWEIIIVLGLYPFILFSTLLYRIIIWPLAPIGEGFGMISFLASVEKRSLALLDGATFSGQLKSPVFVGFSVGNETDERGFVGRGTITSKLATTQQRSERVKRRTVYS